MDGLISNSLQKLVLDGKVTAPGLAFASDPDSGLYRIGANNIGLSLNGTKIVDFTTTGINSTNLGVTTPGSGACTSLSATGALTYGGVALTAAVTGTGSMVLSASPTLTGIVTGAKFISTSGSAGGLSLNTWVPLFTLATSAAYLVSVSCDVGAAGYSAVSAATNDGGNCTININGWGTSMETRVNGTAFEARQTASGSTLTASWCALRIK
jgi:hypothetical protein